MREIIKLFNKPRIIGIIGNTNEAKSNLLYHIIEECKKEGKFSLYTYGLKYKIKNSQEIYSIEELEQIRNSIIILDEIMNMWDLDNRMDKRKIEKNLRMIFHNNNVLIICALPENIKKFIASKLDIVIFKKSTIADFINGSRVKNILLSYKGNELGSSILNIPKDKSILFDGINYHKLYIPYYKKYDSKKENKSIIVKKIVKKKI